MGALRPIQRAAYLSHARSEAFARRCAAAEATIRAALALMERPYLAWSAGKDSTALLGLMQRIAPEVPVRIMTRLESRLLHPDLDDVMEALRERFPALRLVEINAEDIGEYGTRAGNLRRILLNTAEVEGKPDDPDPGAGARVAGTFAGTFDGVFLGLRGAENNGRRISLRAHRSAERFGPHPIHRYADSDPHGRGGSLRACPLQDWSVDDVWAMIALGNLPLLRAYALDGPDSRTSMTLTQTGLRLGEAHTLHARNPDGYRRLMEVAPERLSPRDERHERHGRDDVAVKSLDSPYPPVASDAASVHAREQAPRLNPITPTPHCIQRYTERVLPAFLRSDPRAFRIAMEELACALSDRPHFDVVSRDGHRLIGLTNRHGQHFTVKVAQGEDGSLLAETCGPAWFWHEVRKYWREHGVTHSKGSKGNPETLRRKAEERRKRRAESVAAEFGDAASAAVCTSPTAPTSPTSPTAPTAEASS